MRQTVSSFSFVVAFSTGETASGYSSLSSSSPNTAATGKVDRFWIIWDPETFVLPRRANHTLYYYLSATFRHPHHRIKTYVTCSHNKRWKWFVLEGLFQQGRSLSSVKWLRTLFFWAKQKVNNLLRKFHRCKLKYKLLQFCVDIGCIENFYCWC